MMLTEGTYSLLTPQKTWITEFRLYERNIRSIRRGGYTGRKDEGSAGTYEYSQRCSGRLQQAGEQLADAGQRQWHRSMPRWTRSVQALRDGIRAYSNGFKSFSHGRRFGGAGTEAVAADKMDWMVWMQDIWQDWSRFMQGMDNRWLH